MIQRMITDPDRVLADPSTQPQIANELVALYGITDRPPGSPLTPMIEASISLFKEAVRVVCLQSSKVSLAGMLSSTSTLPVQRWKALAMLAKAGSEDGNPLDLRKTLEAELGRAESTLENDISQIVVSHEPILHCAFDSSKAFELCRIPSLVQSAATTFDAHLFASVGVQDDKEAKAAKFLAAIRKLQPSAVRKVAILGCEGDTNEIRKAATKLLRLTSACLDGFSPLMLRAMTDNTALLAAYIAEHEITDVSVPSKSGFTALHAAISTQAARCVGLLLERRASITETDAAGDSALHMAVQACIRDLGGPISVLTQMLRHAAPGDLGQRSGAGKTALHIAVESACVLAAKALLERGAAAHETRDSWAEMLKALCSFGPKKTRSREPRELADATARHGEWDPQVQVLQRQELSTVTARLILSHGAGLHVDTVVGGSSPLHTAAACGHAPLLQLYGQLSGATRVRLIDASFAARGPLSAHRAFARPGTLPLLTRFEWHGSSESDGAGSTISELCRVLAEEGVFPSLASFHLRNTGRPIALSALQPLVAPGAVPCLVKLVIADAAIATSEDAAVIGRMASGRGGGPPLEEIHLMAVEAFDGLDLGPVVRWTNLRHLRLSHWESSARLGGAAAVDRTCAWLGSAGLGARGALPALRTLDLRASSASGRILRALADGPLGCVDCLPALTALNLSDHGAVGAEEGATLAACVRGCPNLVRLSIGSSRMDPAAVTALLDGAFLAPSALQCLVELSIGGGSRENLVDVTRAVFEGLLRASASALPLLHALRLPQAELSVPAVEALAAIVSAPPVEPGLGAAASSAASLSSSSGEEGRVAILPQLRRVTIGHHSPGGAITAALDSVRSSPGAKARGLRLELMRCRDPNADELAMAGADSLQMSLLLWRVACKNQSGAEGPVLGAEDSATLDTVAATSHGSWLTSYFVSLASAANAEELERALVKFLPLDATPGGVANADVSGALSARLALQISDSNDAEHAAAMAWSSARSGGGPDRLSPLHAAAMGVAKWGGEAALRCLRALLQHTKGLSVDSLDSSRRTPLVIAALADDEHTGAEAVRLLMEAGADPHKLPRWGYGQLVDGRVDGTRGLSPLGMAAKAGRVIAVREMLGLPREVCAGELDTAFEPWRTFDHGSAFDVQPPSGQLGLVESGADEEEAGAAAATTSAEAEAGAAAATTSAEPGSAPPYRRCRRGTLTVEANSVVLGRWLADGSVPHTSRVLPSVFAKARAVSELGTTAPHRPTTGGADSVSVDAALAADAPIEAMEASMEATEPAADAAMEAAAAAPAGQAAAECDAEVMTEQVTVSLVRAACAAVLAGRWCSLAAIACACPDALDASVRGVVLGDLSIFCNGHVEALAQPLLDAALETHDGYTVADRPRVVSAKFLALLAMSAAQGRLSDGSTSPLWSLRASLRGMYRAPPAFTHHHMGDILKVREALGALKETAVLRGAKHVASQADMAIRELEQSVAKHGATMPQSQPHLVAAHPLGLVLRLAGRGVRCVQSLEGVMRAIRSDDAAAWRKGGARLCGGAHVTMVCIMLQQLPAPVGVRDTTEVQGRSRNSRMQSIAAEVQSAASNSDAIDVAVVVPGCGYALLDDAIIV